jgi:hypothetical protein
LAALEAAETAKTIKTLEDMPISGKDVEQKPVVVD